MLIPVEKKRSIMLKWDLALAVELAQVKDTPDDHIFGLFQEKLFSK